MTEKVLSSIITKEFLLTANTSFVEKPEWDLINLGSINITFNCYSSLNLYYRSDIGPSALPVISP